MDTLSKIAAILFAVFLIFSLWRYIRSNPQSLTWPNINKSMYTVGLLALALIAFIGGVVLLLRH